MFSFCSCVSLDHAFSDLTLHCFPFTSLFFFIPNKCPSMLFRSLWLWSLEQSFTETFLSQDDFNLIDQALSAKRDLCTERKHLWLAGLQGPLILSLQPPSHSNSHIPGSIFRGMISTFAWKGVKTYSCNIQPMLQRSEVVSFSFSFFWQHLFFTVFSCAEWAGGKLQEHSSK